MLQSVARRLGHLTDSLSSIGQFIYYGRLVAHHITEAKRQISVSQKYGPPALEGVMVYTGKPSTGCENCRYVEDRSTILRI